MNHVTITGIVKQEFKTAHVAHGERFLTSALIVPRLSGAVDVLPIIISERLFVTGYPQVGDTINCIGQFRSMNKIENGKSKLVLFVFVQKLSSEFTTCNEIVLNGYLCKPPVYRTTPLNKEITDLLIAVNRKYKHSDYIPCVAWGRNARFVEQLPVGAKLTITGRIQSREYTKKLNETNSKTMTAYEVSISSITVEGDENDIRKEND